MSDLPALLLVDDDSMISESLAFVLRGSFDVSIADTRASARSCMLQMGEIPCLALVDLGLPPATQLPDEGFALIGELLAINPSMKILVLSGQSDRANAQHALTLGAVDFIPKPCDVDLLKTRLEHQQMMLEVELLERKKTNDGGAFLGESRPICDLRLEIERYADTPFPVLIQGESGTGKEVVAALLHKLSEREGHPFLTVNCAAFTPELLESQLFGHAKGAFTGANTAKAGFFEDAGAGTLLLDEIGEFPLQLQPKLLRVLENGEYYRIGETRARFSEARIVATTNRTLLDEISAGSFRHDLYHRLSVLTVHTPPLRSRGEDSIILLDHFRALYAQKNPPFSLSVEALSRWRTYSFPGNVRELRNIVIRLGAKFPGAQVGLTALEAELDSQSEIDENAFSHLREGGFNLEQILSGWEQRYIDAALKLSKGNLSEAARLLGVNRTTLYSKIQRLSGENGTDSGSL